MDVETVVAPETEAPATPPAKSEKPKKKKRSTFRRVRSLPAMSMLEPYLLVNRTGSQNLINDRIYVAKLEQYIREKQAEGMKNITFMHVLLCAYARIAAERPAVNRFIRGQRIWTRDEVEIALTIKKEMTLEAPDTVIKVTLPRGADMSHVYHAMNDEIESYRREPGGDFDTVSKLFSLVPGILLKFLIWLLKLLDYFALLPRVLTKVSPFHCSLFITSMGSLGIPPVFHHLYDFGTCPVFLSFGTKKRVNEIDDEGKVIRRSYIDLTVVTDERICDGFYFASALKMFKNIMRNPWQLDLPAGEVKDDIP